MEQQKTRRKQNILSPIIQGLSDIHFHLAHVQCYLSQTKIQGGNLILSLEIVSSSLTGPRDILTFFFIRIYLHNQLLLMNLFYIIYQPIHYLCSIFYSHVSLIHECMKNLLNSLNFILNLRESILFLFNVVTFSSIVLQIFKNYYFTLQIQHTMKTFSHSK